MPDPQFRDFDLDPRVLAAVERLGFETPTPIQGAAIPPLRQGRDVIGQARTGSGKTAAFGLPLLELVKDGDRDVRGLVLAPTRELALQVTEALRDYAKNLPVRLVTVYGGASYHPQLKALKRGVPIVVGTPGRILDLMDRGALDLSRVEMVVLDEADEMLRMGFIDDVERILAATPRERQTCLFSATMPDRIIRIADAHLRDPVTVQVEDSAMSVDHIDQRWMRVPQRHKLEALVRVLTAQGDGATLVFARTRRGCAEVADALAQRGMPVEALHGDLNQAARERVVSRLRSGHLDVVIATDVAARGIDVDHLTHVINLDVPPVTESYVHRIGRTARAGRKGTATSFVTPAQKRRIRDLQRDLGVPIEQIEVPSDGDIARRRQDALKRTVGQRLDDDGARAAELVAELMEDTGADATEIAAAALQALAAAQGVPLEPVRDDAPPAWTRKRSTDHMRADSGDVVELFFPVGRRHNVRPKDFVGALANDAGVPGPRIGKVTIVDRKSFVGLPRELAHQVLNQQETLCVRGMDVPIALARPRPPRHHRNGRRPRR